MKQHIESILRQALKKLQQENIVSNIADPIVVEATKDRRHGDYASPLALHLAKAAHKKPREMAENIIAALPPSTFVDKVEIAGPGFINFFLSTHALTNTVVSILTEKENYGRCQIGRAKKILLEFVSSNPTGPLHVGHGRHAIFGNVIANLLDAVGFRTQREYYVNDAGRQMAILTISIWLRYLALTGVEIAFPMNGYQGDYINEIALTLHKQYGNRFQKAGSDILQNLPQEVTEENQEQVMDGLISNAKSLLGEDYQLIHAHGLDSILSDIRQDLTELGVEYQTWCSEQSLVTEHAVTHLIEKLRENGYVYEEAGALWFRATAFNDEKDRVLIRSNGQATYFANDAAYHLNKFERGFDLAIDILGADHHGYTARIKAVVAACGINPERLICILLQFVSLYRGKTQVAMSTRGGKFVTLRELRNEVGNDAARFFYVLRKSDQPIDFDLDLAKSQSNDNPIYYVQYAHARIASVFRQLAERNLTYDWEEAKPHLALLKEPEERELLNTLSHYPDMIIHAALQYEPHQLTHYLRELAGSFHTYYNAYAFLVEDANLRNARLSLIQAIRQVLANGLALLDVTALDSM